MPKPHCITSRVVAFFVITLLLCLFAALPHAFIITPIQSTDTTNTWAFTIYGSSDVIDVAQPVTFTKLVIAQLNAIDTPSITLTTATIEVYSKKSQQVIIPPTTTRFTVIDTMPTVEIAASSEQQQPSLHDDTIFYSLRIFLTTTNATAAGDAIVKFQVTTTTSDNKEAVENGETKFLWTQPTPQLFPRSTRQYHPNVVKPVRTIDTFETKLIAFATHNPTHTPTAYVDVAIAAPWKIDLGANPSCFINGNNYTTISLRPRDAEIGAVNVLRVTTNAKDNALHIPHGLPFSLECDNISFTPYAPPTNLTTTATYRTAYSGDLIVSLYDQDGVVHDVFASESVQQSVVQVALDRFPTLTESRAYMGINLRNAKDKTYIVYRTYHMIYPLGTKNMVKTNDSFVQLSAQLTSVLA